MLLQQQILHDIQSLTDPVVLNQLYGYVSSLKKANEQQKSNTLAVLQFLGTINNQEAAEISTCIDLEFNKIEGEW
ncbi:MAG: hypothetical protein KA783_04170 [Chitinophagales bacterium]|jgi:hypothetical protein|nr:hypothetical protein [Sphingobacteriales bacterium]MBP7533618.1 hypothetical protein [Chitinophagales bacterium]